MFDRSSPRIWYTPSVTSYSPCRAHSAPCRHRLGFTVAGAGSDMRCAKASLSHTTLPEASFTTPGFSAATNPRSASSKSVVSSNDVSVIARAPLCGRGAREAGTDKVEQSPRTTERP